MDELDDGQKAFSTFRVLNGDANSVERDQLFRNMAQLYSYVSDRCDDEQVAQYDEVLCQLAELVEVEARTHVAKLLAPLDRAPGNVVVKLANDDIEVAGAAARILQRAVRRRSDRHRRQPERRASRRHCRPRQACPSGSATPSSTWRTELGRAAWCAIPMPSWARRRSSGWSNAPARTPASPPTCAAAPISTGSRCAARSTRAGGKVLEHASRRKNQQVDPVDHRQGQRGRLQPHAQPRRLLQPGMEGRLQSGQGAVRPQAARRAGAAALRPLRLRPPCRRGADGDAARLVRKSSSNGSPCRTMWRSPWRSGRSVLTPDLFEAMVATLPWRDLPTEADQANVAPPLRGARAAKRPRHLRALARPRVPQARSVAEERLAAERLSPQQSCASLPPLGRPLRRARFVEPSAAGSPLPLDLAGSNRI